MDKRVSFSPVDGKSDGERELPEFIQREMPIMHSVSSTPFPATVSHLVEEYSSDNNREYVRSLLFGVQPITLCLSQEAHSKLPSCWSLGFLPPEHQWETLDVNINMECLIKDEDACLRFLEKRTPNGCRILIDVLVVKLNLTSRDSRNALENLRKAIAALHNHLNTVKRLVISIAEYVSCCFTLKNDFNDAVGIPLPVDRQQLLFQIIDDLESCWNDNHPLAASALFDFYFNGNARRASKTYLVKFAVSINHHFGQTLFQEQSPKVHSNKIMWIYQFEDLADDPLDRDAARLCHAIQLDLSHLSRDAYQKSIGFMEHAFCFEDNRFIERIVINSLHARHIMQLPRPSAPLTDDTPLSALIELTLNGDRNTIHLSQLNNGYFPNLMHLTIIGGFITGQLDSYCVPKLKTFLIDPVHVRYRDVVRKYTQSCVDADRPWQLVATGTPGGWSLASYGDPTPNPQEDSKEGSLHSPTHSQPLIRELLLVGSSQLHVNEWISYLDSGASVGENLQERKGHRLVWTLQCLENITVFCTTERGFSLNLDMAIPEQTSIVSSLKCYNGVVLLDGGALPCLESLELNGANVFLASTFPHLEKLSLEDTLISSPWEVNAPRLRSFSYRNVQPGFPLCLRPHLLSRLSFLQVLPRDSDPSCCLQILFDDDDVLGLSKIEHCVFGMWMIFTPFFNQCQVQNLLHLELTLNVSKLPACWHKTDWQCKTLKVNAVVSILDDLALQGVLPTTVLPPLPRVEKLTVSENKCRVLLDGDMPNLTDCSVPLPGSLGSNLKCPMLRWIRYTGTLSESDIEKCLDRTTYEAIGAQPRLVYFGDGSEAKRMSWNIPLV